MLSPLIICYESEELYMRFCNNNGLSLKETAHWKRIFNERLIFGSEIEFESGNRTSSYTIRDEVECTSYEFGNGVDDIDSDGSLRSGAEVKTKPRYIDSFIQLYSGYRSIVESLYDYNPLINTRAGWHNHISLSSVGGMKAFEKKIPSVIVKNIITMFKIYYPALRMFSSTMPENQYCITRNDRFCLTTGLRRINNDMTLKERLDTIEGGTRYNALNCRSIAIDRNNDCTEFHIETRFPDGSLFPFEMASYQILIKALILKAVELSHYGELDVDGDYERKLMFISNDVTDSNYLPNGTCEEDFDFDYEDNMADRGAMPLSEENMNTIKSMGNDLLNLLENEINSIDEKAFEFIKVLMNKPIYEIFRELNTNDPYEVNDYLEEIIDNSYEVKTASEEAETLSKFISLNTIKTATEEEWKNQIGTIVNFSKDIDSILDEINSIREISFKTGVGYYYV